MRTSRSLSLHSSYPYDALREQGGRLPSTMRSRKPLLFLLFLALVPILLFWRRTSDYLTETEITYRLNQGGRAILSPRFEDFVTESSQDKPVPTITGNFFRKDRTTIPAFPRKPILSASAPKPADIMFVVATAAERARSSVTFGLWPHFMTSGSSCLVLLPPDQSDKVDSLKEHLTAYGINCHVKASDSNVYPHRVLSLPKEALALNEPFKWLVMGDDDTLWLDLRTLQRMLAKYDEQEMHYIGSTSESQEAMEIFGRMTYGGGGLIMNEKLVRRFVEVHPECLKIWPTTFGGDEVVNNCAARAQGFEHREQAYKNELGMHQFDIKGLAAGFLQSGLPMLNLHHFFTWAGLMPEWMHDQDNYRILDRMLKAAKFLGGDNMFRRYSFDGGRTILVNGYTITRYAKPLTAEDHKRMEVTWGYGADRDLTFEMTRPPIRELWEEPGERDVSGQRKCSYYLQDVTVIDEEKGQAMFIYRNRQGQEIELFWNEQERQ